MLRALRHLLLAAALLVAWQGALLHPLQHVDAHGELIHHAHDHDPHETDDEDGGPDALCDAIAAVGSCLGGKAKIFAVAQRGGERAESPRSVTPRGSAPPPYLSQAPPVHS